MYSHSWEEEEEEEEGLLREGMERQLAGQKGECNEQCV